VVPKTHEPLLEAEGPDAVPVGEKAFAPEPERLSVVSRDVLAEEAAAEDALVADFHLGPKRGVLVSKDCRASGVPNLEARAPHPFEHAEEDARREPGLRPGSHDRSGSGTRTESRMLTTETTSAPRNAAQKPVT
jgi:hypothetical protein